MIVGLQLLWTTPGLPSLLAVVAIIVMAVISVRIAMRKGYSQIGFSLFAFFVPVFPLVCAVAFPEKESKRVEVTNFAQHPLATPQQPSVGMVACYWCAEPIQAAARLCRHCGRETATDQPTPQHAHGTHTAPAQSEWGIRPTPVTPSATAAAPQTRQGWSTGL